MSHTAMRRSVLRGGTSKGLYVDYLFLQVWPDRAEVSDNQNCGNLAVARVQTPAASIGDNS
jgi:2-methylaconitate cis-trans-isomerase PrpF